MELYEKMSKGSIRVVDGYLELRLYIGMTEEEYFANSREAMKSGGYPCGILVGKPDINVFCPFKECGK